MVQQLLLLIVVAPVATLVHELGHALVALWRTDGAVFVRLRAMRRLWELRSGRLRVDAGPSEVAMAGGYCAFDARGASPADRALIALGGPAASLLGAGVTGLLWSRTGGGLRELFAVATLCGLAGGLVNLLPIVVSENRRPGARRLALDGYLALEALRARRPPAVAPTQARDVKAGPVAERWAAEVDAAGERARALRASANVARLRARDDERRTGSMPPPGFSRD